MTGPDGSNDVCHDPLASLLLGEQVPPLTPILGHSGKEEIELKEAAGSLDDRVPDDVSSRNFIYL